MSVIGTAAAVATFFLSEGNPYLTSMAPAIGEGFVPPDVPEVETERLDASEEGTEGDE
jgi:hypothetical protein